MWFRRKRDDSEDAKYAKHAKARDKMHGAYYSYKHACQSLHEYEYAVDECRKYLQELPEDHGERENVLVMLHDLGADANLPADDRRRLMAKRVENLIWRIRHPDDY